MKRFFETLYMALARGARAVLQVYPENAAQAELLVSSAMKASARLPAPRAPLPLAPPCMYRGMHACGWAPAAAPARRCALTVANHVCLSASHTASAWAPAPAHAPDRSPLTTRLERPTAACLPQVGFSGGLVVDFPHSTRAKKYYLVLMVGSTTCLPQVRAREARMGGARPCMQADAHATRDVSSSDA